MVKKLPFAPVWFEKGRTYVGIQIGKHVVMWCFLMGGHWKHYFQPSRFSYFKESE